MPRPKQKFTALIENVCRAEARGEQHDKILEEYFGLAPGCDKRLKHNAEAKMTRWRKMPEWQPAWDDEMIIRVRRGAPRAVGKLEQQIESSNEWVANKASNDYLGLAAKVGVIKSTESNAMEVHIVGMPEIGSPADDEQDV